MVQKIGISTLFLKTAGIGGTEHMLHGLLTGLVQLPDIELTIFFNPDLDDWFAPFRANYRAKLVPVKILGNRFLSEFIQIPILAKQYRLDAMIFPNYFTPLIPNIPCITVIHDLNYLYFPIVVSPIKRWWLRCAHLMTLKLARKVIAISEFVRQDILQTYRVSDPTHIVTIPNPVNWSRFTVSQAPRCNLSKKFILSVAYHYRHKNLSTLIIAFAQLLPDFPDLQLVLVGQLAKHIAGIRTTPTDDIPALVTTLNLTEQIIITGYVSDAELTWYYQQATVFAFPSVFEGFGLPPVEALGMGLPVVTTNCPAIPEATLGIAQYVSDPYDPRAWAECLRQVLVRPSAFTPSADMTAKIRQIYDPRTIAQQYLQLCRGE
ncbi:MAG: glycosyltransferase family 4 protein [Pseudanabaenaceae cyanobacterium]